MKRLWPLLLFLLFGASVYVFWIAPLRKPPKPLEIQYRPSSSADSSTGDAPALPIR